MTYKTNIHEKGSCRDSSRNKTLLTRSKSRYAERLERGGTNIQFYMEDQITQQRLLELHPAVRQRFEDFINEVEDKFRCIVRMEPPLRSFQTQQDLWDQGRTKPGPIVTWAPPGSSYHNYGLAADLCPFKPDHPDLDWNYDFSKWEGLAIKHGMTWGGTFPKEKTDPDHYEYKAGYNWRDLLHKRELKDFIPGTEYVNL